MPPLSCWINHPGGINTIRLKHEGPIPSIKEGSPPRLVDIDVSPRAQNLSRKVFPRDKFLRKPAVKRISVRSIQWQGGEKTTILMEESMECERHLADELPGLYFPVSAFGPPLNNY